MNNQDLGTAGIILLHLTLQLHRGTLVINMTFIRCQRKKRKEIIAHHPKEEDLDHDTEKDQDLQEFDQM